MKPSPPLPAPSAAIPEYDLDQGDGAPLAARAINRTRAPESRSLATTTPWVARFFHSRRGFSLAPGDSSLAAFCVALEGDLRLQVGQGAPLSYRSVLLIPGGGAGLYSDAAVACLYLEAGGIDFDLIRRSMSASASGLPIGHRREAELSIELRDILESDCTIPERSDRIAQIFGLPGPRSIDWRIARAIQMIREDPSLPHRAEALARQVGLSESRFRHAFREATGLSLTRFRVWTRLRAAMSLALAGGSLTQAAHEAGFSSSAHLSSVHRAMFGLTPSAILAAQRAQRSPTAALSI